MTASSRGGRVLAQALQSSSQCTRCAFPSQPRLYSTAAATATAPEPSSSSSDTLPSHQPVHSHSSAPYDVLSGLILTRPPLLTRKLHPFENAFFFYQKRLEERLNTPFVTSIYFKPDTPRLQDWNIKVKERSGTPAKELGEYHGKTSRAWDDELKVGDELSSQDNIVDSLLKDGQVRVSEDAEVIPVEDVVKLESPLSRRSEADEKGDMKRLDREMDRTLYLVVKNEEGWGFPADLVKNENLHEAAQRVLDQAAGVNMNTWIVGRVPVAHTVKEPVRDTSGGVQQRGRKTFLLKGRIMAGQANLEGNPFGYTEFKWVTREELKEIVPEGVYRGVRNMMAIR